MEIKDLIETIAVNIFMVLLCTVYASGQQHTHWLDLEGNPYPSALSGGFQAPQFSDFDLDNDGVPEIISFDRYSGIVQVWQKDEGAGDYILSTEVDIEWPTIRSWMLVRDFDRDGVPDIFTQGLHGIAVYRGKYEGGRLVFESMSGSSFLDDSLIFHNRSGGTTNIYHAATDIPVIEDLDGDGDLDILTFELSGTYLYYYENRENETGIPLDFVLRHNCWGYFAEHLFSDEINLAEPNGDCPPPFSVRHAGSTSCLLDYDYNGTMDLILGDIGSGFLKVLLNRESSTNAFIERVIHEFPHTDTVAELPFFPAAFRIDVDGDSIPDVIVASNEFPTFDQQGVWWYRGTDDPNHPFELQTRSWLSKDQIDLGHYSAPLFFDVNADGIPDVLVAYQYLDRQQMTLNRIAYFEAINENTYYLRDMDFKSLSDEMLRGYRPYLTSGDVNGDGAEDLLIGMSDGSYYLIINGSARGEPFTVQQVQEDWAGLRLRSGATPELFDVDGDGDLDVVAGMDNGWIGLWINTGNAQTAKFNADLSANPNINMLGNVRTVGSQSLLGRSAPRLVVNQSDTILLTGSHEGQLYAYHFEWSKRTSSFLPVETDQWPEWVGGNGRLAIQALDNHKFRFLAGNIAGGLIEREVNVLSTHSTREDGVINKIQVFPNPIRNGELLRIHADRHRILDKIVVRSVSGLPWKTLNVSSIVTEISTLGLHPGIYFVELNYRALHREVKKLVVY